MCIIIITGPGTSFVRSSPKPCRVARLFACELTLLSEDTTYLEERNREMKLINKQTNKKSDLNIYKEKRNKTKKLKIRVFVNMNMYMKRRQVYKHYFSFMFHNLNAFKNPTTYITSNSFSLFRMFAM